MPRVQPLPGPRALVATLLTLGFIGCSSAIQQADLGFEPPIARPAYPPGSGRTPTLTPRMVMHWLSGLTGSDP